MAAAANDERMKLLESVKRDVRSLLISSKTGLSISELYKDYKSLTFDPLPFRKLGFDTARQLLLSMPDVCDCRVDPGGDIHITAVADASTAHIERMVQRQKPAQKKRGGRAPSYPSSRIRYSSQPSYRSSLTGTSSSYSRSRVITSSRAPQPVQPAPAARPPPLLPDPVYTAPVASLMAVNHAAKAVAASVQEQPVPETMVGQLASTLLAFVERGVPVDQLERQFEKRTGAPLDWRRLGYRSCAALLLTVPHVARVVNSFTGLVAYPSRSLLAASEQLETKQSPRGRSPAPVLRSDHGSEGEEAEEEDCDEDEFCSGRESPPPSLVPPDGPGEGPEQRLAAEQRSSHTESPTPTGSGRSGKRNMFLASVSPIIQQLVERHPAGLQCSKLVQEYRKQTGHELDVTGNGYHSVLDLISKLPVKAVRSHNFSDWLLFSQAQPLPAGVHGDAAPVSVNLDDLPEVAGGDRLRETKQRIREILLSFPDGLRMNGLEDHYEMNYNERLPLAELGYSSVETFVLRCSGDVLQIRYTDNDIKLFPVLPNRPERSLEEHFYPADAVGPGRSFSRVEVPDIPLGEYNLEIYVAEVYNPHKFWFHLVGAEHSEALEKVMDDMELVFYTPLGSKYRMTADTVQVGQVCACPYGQQGYHRAVITAVRADDETVKVFYVDYGSIGSVPRRDIRFLPEKFFGLPAQALLGKLAHILPTSADGWNREASQAFLSLVDKNRILYAMIRNKTPTCVHVCLCDTNGEVDVHVNDRMVELGHAVFRERSNDSDNPQSPTMEEQARPVPLPGPLAVAVAGSSREASLQPSHCSPVESSSRRSSPQSATDGLLQEAARAEEAAAEELDALIDAELADVDDVKPPPAAGLPGAAATPVPSMSIPGHPPGFSPQRAAQLPTFSQPAAAAAAASVDNSAALTAILGSLQMQMQLQNMLNPLMNPYAALLMNQAVTGAGLAGPRPPAPPSAAAATQEGGAAAVSSVSASAAETMATPAATTVTSQSASSCVTSQTAPVMQDAGVCVTEPVQSVSSVQDMSEAGTAPKSGSLMEPAEQTRFVKRLYVQGTQVHVINLNSTGYMVSSEISRFLWKRDILKTMLRMRNLNLPQLDLTVEEHPQLFTELVSYAVAGVLDGVDLVDPLPVYPLSTVATVFATMRNMTEIYNAKVVVEDISAQFDPLDPFWTSSVADDLDETQPVQPAPEPASPSPSPSPLPLPLPRPARASSPVPSTIAAASSPGSEPRSPPPPGRRRSQASVVSPAAHAPSVVTDAVATQLLPEMQTILAQLLTKRQRKVEATALALEGTDIAVEAVIGDDLRQMDAQIDTFKKRIHALGGDMSHSSGSCTIEDALSWARRPRTSSVRTSSISMNPDAPEFVFSSGETSVYASPDSTVYGGDGAASDGGRSDSAAAGRRSSISVRAADGTPVSLAQLTQKKPAVVNLTSPDGKEINLKKLTSAGGRGDAGVDTVKARKPIELKTPDGRPVELRRQSGGEGDSSADGGSEAAAAALPPPVVSTPLPSKAAVTAAMSTAAAQWLRQPPTQHSAPSWSGAAPPPPQPPPQPPQQAPLHYGSVPPQTLYQARPPVPAPQQAMPLQQRMMMPYQQQQPPQLVPQQYPAVMQQLQRFAGVAYQPYPQLYQPLAGPALQYHQPAGYPAGGAPPPRYPSS